MLRSGLRKLRAALLNREVSSADLVDEALTRIGEGEGPRAFTLVLADEAREEARRADALLAGGRGGDLPLLGIPISIKDLFDLKGRVTTAGSTVLSTEAPAERDAAIVARLRAAGAVIVGRTNMSEFAFSGLGLNPHYGTPRNPWDRETGRAPGGSSSGAAVSVTDGMCAAAIGTDTGGSVRIPSALCGLAGFKPTQATVPLAGAYPLSTTLDSIGPLARSIGDCSLLHDVLSGSPSPAVVLPETLRLAVPTNYFLDGLDAAVAADFEAALARLADAGHSVERIEVPGFDRLAEAGRIGSFPAIEAYAMQKERLSEKGDAVDQRVRRRIEAAAGLPADTLPRLREMRRSIMAEVAQTLRPFDAFIGPTVPMIAPGIAELASDDDHFVRINLLMLRNPSAVNFIDGCAASLPMHQPGAAPTGLSVAGLGGMDRKVLAVSCAIQGILRGGTAAGDCSNVVRGSHPS